MRGLTVSALLSSSLLCVLILFLFKHIEQMLFPFVHHQLKGETRWFIIPHSQLEKLYLLAAEMYGVLYGVTGQSDEEK